MQTENRIILAADELDFQRCHSLMRRIGNRIYAIRINNLYDLEGPDVLEYLHDSGAPLVWVDTKLHNSPKAVKLRARALMELGCDIITVHASGGVEMMQAAVEEFEDGEVFAVTVLASLNENEVEHIYRGHPPIAVVERLAKMAEEARVAGVVCSLKEAGMLSTIMELSDLKFVVDNQEGIETPLNAFNNGATHFVIGDQLTKAADPANVLDEFEAALNLIE